MSREPNCAPALFYHFLPSNLALVAPPLDHCCVLSTITSRSIRKLS